MNDLSLQDAVLAELEWDPKVDASEVEVTAKRGAVTLDGRHITLRPHAPTAADVEHRIEDAIERMADLDARSIWVTTSDGTVRLHGTVRSLAERRIAQHAAESAPGVTAVENELVVAI